MRACRAALYAHFLGLLLYVTSVQGEGLNDQCTLRNGKPGKCRWFEECESAQIDLESDISPITCSMVRFRRIVCCDGSVAQRGSDEDVGVEPTSPSRKILTLADLPPEYRGKKSWEKCIEYANEVYQPETAGGFALNRDEKVHYKSECASSAQSLIIGGEKAAPKEFPHMVALGYGVQPNSEWRCGGSLISERYVLTAAHCLFLKGRGPVRWVRVGELNLVKDNDNAKPMNYAVENFTRHPEYHTKNVYHDIALLYLKTAVKFSGYVRPACLNTLRSTRVNELATATGWGLTENSTSMGSDDLLKVEIRYQKTSRCSATFKSDRFRLPRGVDARTMICAGGRGKDTCNGDSGGPLQVYLTSPFDCMYSIVGVTSYGSSACGQDSPALYTRVSYYVPWIEGIVWQ